MQSLTYLPTREIVLSTFLTLQAWEFIAKTNEVYNIVQYWLHWYKLSYTFIYDILYIKTFLASYRTIFNYSWGDKVVISFHKHQSIPNCVVY